jgi:hypothetical protein
VMGTQEMRPKMGKTHRHETILLGVIHQHGEDTGWAGESFRVSACGVWRPCNTFHRVDFQATKIPPHVPTAGTKS